MVYLYLIRHAECEMNLAFTQTIGGRSNESPLTPNGVSQSHKLGLRLQREGISFKDTYSSIAVRTKETLKHAGVHNGFTLEDAIVTPDLQELDQGDWEGADRKATYTPEVVKEIQADPWNFKAPHGESQRDVEERMLEWTCENITTRYRTEDSVGVFTHGIATKCFLRGVLNFDPENTYKLHIDNTAITTLKHDDKGWHVLGINDASHIKE